MLHWALSFHDKIFKGEYFKFQKYFHDTDLDDNLMYEKEFISLYILGISEKVKSISQFLFLIFNAQCIIYDTFSFLNFGG